MSNGFMTNWVTPWSLWPEKNWSLKIMGRYNGFLSSKVNILSIQAVLFSWYAILLEHQIIFTNLFLWNSLLKLLEKWTTQIKLFNIPLAVYKRLPNIYEIPYTFMIGFLVFSGCMKVCKNLQFNIKTDYWANKLLLENAQLSLSKRKNWILMENSCASTPRVRKVLGIRMINS